MAIVYRLASRHLQKSLLACRQGGSMWKRTSMVKPFPQQPPSTADYDERNMKICRPQSPHLTIYAPQLTSMMSITHRMTGAALGGLVILMGLGALYVGDDPFEAYIEALECLSFSNMLILLGKIIVGFPMVYHYMNGIRHLIWDTGNLLSLKQVYMTGYIVIVLTAVATALLVSM